MTARCKTVGDFVAREVDELGGSECLMWFTLAIIQPVLFLAIPWAGYVPSRQG
jgi:hypothetical protein